MKLAKIFCDHAVFQREREIAVFGEGCGHIVVEIGESRVEYVSENSEFLFYLPPMKAGGPYEMTVNLDGETIVLRDIMIGDVILSAGQSNSEVQLSESAVPNDVSDEPCIRTYHARHISKDHPFDDTWNVMTCENSGAWNAIPYYMAKKLFAECGVPIGIVCCSQGAAVIQSFMSPLLTYGFSFPPEKLHPDHTFVEPPHNFAIFNHPSDIYRFMLKPIVPYTVSAVYWYQGESNTSVCEGSRYDEMLKALIIEWRRLFRDPHLPFVVVQINDFDTPFSKEGWKMVQEAQVRAVGEMSRCELVIISDLGEHDIIHPLNKKTVAERICEKLMLLSGSDREESCSK